MYHEPVVEECHDNSDSFFVCSICSTPLLYPYFKCSCQYKNSNNTVASIRESNLYDPPIVLIEPNENDYPNNGSSMTELQNAIDRAVSFNFNNTSSRESALKIPKNDLFTTDYPDFVFDLQLQNVDNPNCINTSSSVNNSLSSIGTTSNPLDLVPSTYSRSSTDENTVIHYITEADTSLAAIALRYGVKTADIRKANKLCGNNLFEYETLIIPGVPKELQKQLDPKMLESIRKSKLLRKFKWKKGCEEPEAKYYLELTDYDFEKAIKEYNNDINWEKAHPYSPNSMNQRSILNYQNKKDNTQ